MNTAKILSLTSLQYAYEALLADWKRVSVNNLPPSPETAREELHAKCTELVTNLPKDELVAFVVDALAETSAKNVLMKSIENIAGAPDPSPWIQSEIDRLKARLNADKPTVIAQ